jgi:hypothetical protein
MPHVPVVVGAAIVGYVGEAEIARSLPERLVVRPTGDTE